MTPELKERLYKELMQILISLEEGDFNGATMELEYLINLLKYDQL
jgi:hypothetical protein